MEDWGQGKIRLHRRSSTGFPFGGCGHGRCDLPPPVRIRAPPDGARALATDREPPFEGGSQPVPQVKDPVPPSRASPRAGLMLAVVVILLLAGAVFVFELFKG